MYKKVCLLLTVLFFSFTACTQTPAIEEPSASADFTDKEWLFYDEVSTEHLCLNFGNDGYYSYHCQCGEPVGDSDLYDTYEYDEETNLITLSSS